MWMEEHGEKINDARAKQAMDVKADTIAVGCPFCLTMMSDGLKAHSMEEKMTSLDIAEIVWKAMGLEEEKEPVQVCEAPAIWQNPHNRLRKYFCESASKSLGPLDRGFFLWQFGKLLSYITGKRKIYFAVSNPFQRSNKVKLP